MSCSSVETLRSSTSYLMGQARTDDVRAFVEKLYDEALEEGPDFTHHRSKSAFEAAPNLGIDRNAYARILNALDLIECGTYDHNRGFAARTGALPRGTKRRHSASLRA